MGRMNAKLDHLTTLVVSSRREKGESGTSISAVPFSRKKSPDELLAYLSRLDTDMDERENVLTLLSVQCRNMTLKSGLKNMLMLLAGPDVWSYFNKDGQRGKIGLNDTGLVALLINAIQRNCTSDLDKKLKEKKVMSDLSEVLKRMPQHTKRLKERAGRRLSAASRAESRVEEVRESDSD